MDSEDDFWDEASQDDDSEDMSDEEKDAKSATNGGGSAAAAKRRSLGPWRVMDPSEIESERGILVSEIMAIGSLDRSAALGLLIRYEWNKERLTEEYFDDPDKVLAAAGLTALMEGSKDAPPSTPMEMECQICYDTVDSSDAFALACGHSFCRECWTDYLEGRVKQGNMVTRTDCPDSDCTERVYDSMFEQLLSPASKLRYESFLARSFVEDSPIRRWCPGPDCGRAVECRDSSILNVKCECNFEFCFKCGDPAHEPTNCDNLSKWKEKLVSESENATWILANTKKCPKCRTPIEKNQGCNHMTCQSCRHDFCWMCLGPWKDHGSATGGYYKCNRFDPSKPSADGQASADAKTELDRYLHYFQRYDNHDKSKKFAAQTASEMETLMTQLQERGGAGTSWIDVEFLRHACDAVFHCREVLKYTYVHAYYLEDPREREFFEHLQENLEKHVEYLTELTERRKVDDMDGDHRTCVINYTRITKDQLSKLLVGVRNGLRDVDLLGNGGSSDN